MEFTRRDLFEPHRQRFEAEQVAAEAARAAAQEPRVFPQKGDPVWWEDPTQLAALQQWLSSYESAAVSGALAALSKSWGRAITQAEVAAPVVTVDQGRGTEVLTAVQVAFLDAVASPVVVSGAGTVADSAAPIAASLRAQLGESPDEFAGTIVRVENANELSATVR